MEAMAEHTEALRNRRAVVQSAGPALSGALSNVSIVIPVGENETLWRPLLAELARVGSAAECLIVAAQPKPQDFDSFLAEIGLCRTAQWIVSPPGRARQMNHGAHLSGRPFLWFLHADSRVGKTAVDALARSLASHPHAILFFDLAYRIDGPRLAQLNAWGVRFRSRCLGLPFGDQSYCLSRDAFWRLGGFNQEAAYGEDHLLIWAARGARIQLRPVGATISTSARKYATSGWLTTTVLHGWRTWRQAIPELVKLLRSRC